MHRSEHLAVPLDGRGVAVADNLHCSCEFLIRHPIDVADVSLVQVAKVREVNNRGESERRRFVFQSLEKMTLDVLQQCGHLMGFRKCTSSCWNLIACTNKSGHALIYIYIYYMYIYIGIYIYTFSYASFYIYIYIYIAITGLSHCITFHYISSHSITHLSHIIADLSYFISYSHT